MLKLDSLVGSLNMVGPQYVNRLKKLGIETLEDLFTHIPFRYENFSVSSNIASLQVGDSVTVRGKVVSFVNIYSKTGKKIQKLIISDGTASILSLFFNQPFLSNIFRVNAHVALAGEVKYYLDKIAFISPQYEVLNGMNFNLHTGRLVPVYPETEGISSKWLRSRIAPLFFKLNFRFNEFLPPEIISKYNLPDLNRTMINVHFPKTLLEALQAKRRLSFAELFLIQINSNVRKKQLDKLKTGFEISYQKFKTDLSDFINKLPFSLTTAQQNVLTEIVNDLSRETPMNRLLQGDVGSGKTIIAVIISYLIFLSGNKTILMAPTEILVKQHYQTFKNFLKGKNINISLITAKEKPEILKSDIIIGTHALLHHNFAKEKIALVIIDEQQRFGVAQRNILHSKGNNPHLLSMTATPIPRTIALTLYSDLDLSVIDQMPAGRHKVKTFVVPPHKRQAAYNWMEKEIAGTIVKKQAFVICPLIEESETLTAIKSAKKEYERLKSEIFPGFKLGLIHGRLKSGQKDKILKKFQKGEFDILVATPVVEVGIDVKNATIILIEASERFGLSQLHQLRGRVGRNNMESYCLLFSETGNTEVLKRLKILEHASVGIKIAEEDLRLRGPGQIFGTFQHGKLGLKFTDFSDLNLVKSAKEAADFIAGKYHDLSLFPLLRQKLSQYTIQTISPD